MSDQEAISIIEKIRACHLCTDCGLNCQDCIYNFSNEELQVALSIGINAIKDRRTNDENVSVS